MGWSHNCSAQAENINITGYQKKKHSTKSLPRRHFRRTDCAWWANQSSYAVDCMFTLWLFRGFLILSCKSFEASDSSPLWTRQVSSSDFNNSQNSSIWLIWKEKKKERMKKNLVCMWEIQRFEKFIVTLSAAANIKVKETCNNLGSASVCVCRCVCAQLVGIEVIMLLINVAPWLLSQQCSVFGFLLLRWNLVTSLRLLESCRINVRSCLIHSPHNMLWSMRYDSY